MAKTLKRFLVSSSLSHWVEEQGRASASVFLTCEETHHLKDVLRLKEGALCLLFDRDGCEYLSRLERFLPDARCQVRLLEPVLNCEEELFRITVAQAIPQDRKMDEIIRKSAELGVFEVIPLVTERTIVRIADNQLKKVCGRWERIRDQALKQSKLQRAPRITFLTTFAKLCADVSQYDQIFLLHPSLDARPIRECVSSIDSFRMKNRVARYLLIIGPEGGFSPSEVEQAQALGAQAIRLGTGILRTDTAFVASVSFFRFMYS